MLSVLGRAVRRTLWDKVPRDHRETSANLRRRQLVTAAFVVVGAVALAFSLRIKPGNDGFYPATFGLAAIWMVGAFSSGPLHLGRTRLGARPLLMPVVYGVLLAGLFVIGGLVIRQIPALDAQVRHVLDHANEGSVPLLVVISALNGIAEELFFRGALYAATTRYPVVVTTIAYGAATLATGNVMLAFAALLLGSLVGLQRRATGGILAPIITHVVWSVSMLYLLPAVFG